MERFKTIKEKCSAQIIEKKSRFIANIYYVENKKEAQDIIKKVKSKYYDARHNCFAYITFDEEDNIVQKCSDDKEPSGTAGGPILNTIKSKEIYNVLVIVTRYFGGILLGKGGLVRAYSQATIQALESTQYITKILGKEVTIEIEYMQAKKFRNYCNKNNINIIGEEYKDNVVFFIEISNKMIEQIYSNIDNLNFKILKIDKISEKYIDVKSDI